LGLEFADANITSALWRPFRSGQVVASRQCRFKN
jgi:hypothetical protein